MSSFLTVGIRSQVDELIGDGPHRRFLRQLADDLKLETAVHFRGWLHPDDVRKAISTATLLVHPSTGLGDAVPTVIKESMALGTPVIASDVAGIPELLDNGKCGILVPPRDKSALALSMQMLLEEDTKRLQYASAARKYAEEKFDLWRNGKRLAALLNTTARRQR